MIKTRLKSHAFKHVLNAVYFFFRGRAEYELIINNIRKCFKIQMLNFFFKYKLSKK
jgi:hypothetical protein